MTTRIQLRRGTASEWTTVNPTLSSGELGYETNTGKFKIGNGSSLWSALDYFETDLSEYLTTSSASTTYLTQSSASTTYLTQASASTTYLTKNLDIIAAKTGPYTLASGDEGDFIQANGTVTIYVPTDSTFNFAIGTQINLLNIGTGVVSVDAFLPGVTTINATPGLKLRTQWSSATLIKRAANTWVLVGDLTV
jgi:hypothetical protein